jgi:hypothetical protein
VWKLIKEVRTSILESSAFNYLHIVDEWEDPRDDSDLLVGDYVGSLEPLPIGRHS